MKGDRFHRRLGYALAGLRAAWRHEASFRTQAGVAAGLAGLLAVVRPTGAWIAIALLSAAMVLALEAVNAAIEAVADAIHPGHHPGIGRAKDIAAGAVLIASVAAVAVGGCLLWEVTT